MSGEPTFFVYWFKEAAGVIEPLPPIPVSDEGSARRCVRALPSEVVAGVAIRRLRPARLGAPASVAVVEENGDIPDGFLGTLLD